MDLIGRPNQALAASQPPVVSGIVTIQVGLFFGSAFQQRQSGYLAYCSAFSSSAKGPLLPIWPAVAYELTGICHDGDWKRTATSSYEQAENLWELYSVWPQSSHDPANWRTELNRPLKTCDRVSSNVGLEVHSSLLNVVLHD